MNESGLNERFTPRVTRGGTRYVDAGAGPAIVFIHGVGMHLDIWSPQLQFFVNDFRVLAYDVLGHGNSPMPPETVDFSHLEAQLLELLNELEIENVHLVGHSMGALIAIHFALAHPDRVQTLIALNPVYARNDAQSAAVLRRADLLDANNSGQLIDDTLERWFGARSCRANSGDVTAARSALESAGHQGYRRIYRLFSSADNALQGRLEELAMRALFVTGALDPNSTPAMSRLMAEEAPQGEALIIDDARHMMALAQPDAVNRVIADHLRGDDAFGRSGTDMSTNSG